MAKIVRENFTLSSFVSLLNISAKDKSEFEQLIKGFDLLPWEEALAYQFYPLTSTTKKENFGDCENLVKTMRGRNPAVGELTLEEIKKFKPTDTKDSLQRDKLIRTVYVAINFGKQNEVLILLRQLAKNSAAGLFFEGIDAELAAFLRRIYVVLCCYFFGRLNSTEQDYFLHSSLIVLAIEIGFDIEAILADMLKSDSSLFDVRTKRSLELAGFLLDNQTIIGPQNEMDLYTIHFWITIFVNFAQSDLNEMQLLDFLSNDKYFNLTSEADGLIIGIILKLYLHIMNGSIIGIDINNIDITKSNLTADITYAILHVPLTDEDTRNLKKWFAKVSAEQAAAYIKSVIKLDGTDYHSEPLFSNLLQVNDIYMDYYKSGEPLLYFDEKKKDFIFSNFAQPLA
ncbi:hypothetical protein EPN28_01870 [Patescibacteria group bacterium]|nr:MAG: hypothetical protein EPN28_01870 [Patescibacteria group bacterium]